MMAVGFCENEPRNRGHGAKLLDLQVLDRDAYPESLLQAHQQLHHTDGVQESGLEQVGFRGRYGHAQITREQRGELGPHRLGSAGSEAYAHDVTRCATRSHTTPMSSSSSALAGTSRMIVRDPTPTQRAISSATRS